MSPPSPGTLPSRLAKTPTTFLLIAFSLILQLLLWRTSERLKAASRPAGVGWGRRDGAGHSEDDGDTDTLLGIPYAELYASVPPAAKPFAFFGLCLWAAFLFATIGISASDFFCPNLATVADRLGMGESTAGVTFLAFGNGSPDVFSTFSALKSNTFSLAIGELIGASCFIISIVVGCMALTNPFHVPRWPFLRDVGFFTLAVVILVACLGDGHLTVWESGGLVGLYVVYVGVVVGGNWWSSRRRRRTEEKVLAGGLVDTVEGEEEQEWLDSAADDAGADDALEITGDQPQLNLDLLTAPTTPARARSRSSTITSLASLSDARKTPGLTTTRPALRPRKASVNSRSSLTPLNTRTIPDTPRPTFSLLGAIEFRDVVNSLRKESGAGGPTGQGGMISPMAELLDETPSAAGYFGPTTPFGMGHYHPHHFVGNGGSPVGGHHRGASLGGNDGASGGGSGSGRARSVSQTPGTRTRHSYATHPSGVKDLGAVGRATSVPVIPRLERRARSNDDLRRASVPEVIAEAGEGAEAWEGPGEGTQAGLERSLTQETNPWEGMSGQGEGKRVRPKVVIPGTPERDWSRRSSQVPSINLVDPEEEQTRLTVYAGDGGDQARKEEGQKMRKRDRIRALIRETLHLLFPSMHEFSHKSVVGKVLAVFAVPAILCLTVTLPVVDDVAEGCTMNRGGGIALSEGSETDEEGERMDKGAGHRMDLENGNGNGNGYRDDPEQQDLRKVAGQAGHQLHHLVDQGGAYSSTPFPSPHHHHHHSDSYLSASPSAHLHTASPVAAEAGDESGDTTQVVEGDGEDSEGTCPSDQEDEENEINFLFNKYLTAVQCVLGPLFCSYVMFSNQDWGLWVVLGVSVAGCVVAGITLWKAEDGQNSLWRMVRCFMGFFSAMVWISAIADEVVAILAVFGQILGWSNAIIGLTIFAVGNSLADFVANMTVASFAPSMAYAACYGGPLLNILLGVGGAGTYVIISTGSRYPVQFSPTLWVSSIGLVFLLVATLIFVPYNGYYISRQWGIFLICVYVGLTIVNVVVETRHGRT